MAKSKNPYHYILGTILNSRKKEDFFAIAKEEFDLRVLCQVNDAMKGSLSPLLKYFYDIAISKNYFDLGKKGKVFISKKLDKEINWHLLTLRSHKKEVQLFILYKSDFENSFLLGEFDKCKQLIQKINEEISYSIWGLDSTFLLNEYTNESEQNKLLLSEINEKNNGKFTKSLASYISQRTERRLSGYKYDSDLKNILNNVNSKISKDIKDYYNFKLNQFECNDISEFSEILNFESSNSILDRYLFLRNILRYIVSNDIKKYDFLEQKVDYILKQTGDKFFAPLVPHGNKKYNFKDFYSEDFIQILDLYVSGLYVEVIKEIKTILLKTPSIFQLYIIYCKSLIMLKKGFSPLTSNNTPINTILQLMYNSIAEINPKDALFRLYQINKNVYSFDIAQGLNSFIKKEQNIKYNKKLDFLSTYGIACLYRIAPACGTRSEIAHSSLIRF